MDRRTTTTPACRSCFMAGRRRRRRRTGRSAPWTLRRPSRAFWAWRRRTGSTAPRWKSLYQKIDGGLAVGRPVPAVPESQILGEVRRGGQGPAFGDVLERFLNEAFLSGVGNL